MSEEKNNEVKSILLFSVENLENLKIKLIETDKLLEDDKYIKEEINSKQKKQINESIIVQNCFSKLEKMDKKKPIIDRGISISSTLCRVSLTIFFLSLLFVTFVRMFDGIDLFLGGTLAVFFSTSITGCLSVKLKRKMLKERSRLLEIKENAKANAKALEETITKLSNITMSDEERKESEEARIRLINSIIGYETMVLTILKSVKEDESNEYINMVRKSFFPEYVDNTTSVNRTSKCLKLEKRQ